MGGYDRLAVARIFFFPALGGLLFGYDIGATSYVLTQLQSAKFSGVSWSYIAEMSPAAIRGTLVSLKEAAIVVGICLGYGLGFAAETPGGWRYTYAASIPSRCSSTGAHGARPRSTWYLTVLFGIFAVLDLYALHFINRNVPETAA
ncbi:hypothetical protein JL722_14497 [Aureococcus anophagefferens]|nr:hypothetical protein JL722_14497 [Aureococcus anophagefferens]